MVRTLGLRPAQQVAAPSWNQFRTFRLPKRACTGLTTQEHTVMNSSPPPKRFSMIREFHLAD